MTNQILATEDSLLQEAVDEATVATCQETGITELEARQAGAIFQWQARRDAYVLALLLRQERNAYRATLRYAWYVFQEYAWRYSVEAEDDSEFYHYLLGIMEQSRASRVAFMCVSLFPALKHYELGYTVNDLIAVPRGKMENSIPLLRSLLERAERQGLSPALKTSLETVLLNLVDQEVTIKMFKEEMSRIFRAEGAQGPAPIMGVQAFTWEAQDGTWLAVRVEGSSAAMIKNALRHLVPDWDILPSFDHLR